jgi:putrescine aminotransferase
VQELECAIEDIGPERVGAFIGEPIMGVAGMVVPPDDYWPRIAEVLQRHGILLILDEVVTAYGRIGEWFAAQRFGIEPDIIVTAKGVTSGYIPLGAVLVSGEVAEALGEGDGWPMGYTYNGHPTACAVALANLEIIEREDLLAAAQRTGAFLLSELTKLSTLPVVGEVRGAGMMLAVELVADKETRTPLPVADDPLPDVIRREFRVIVRDCANDVGHSLVLSPPLTMSEEEARTVAAAIGAVLERTGADGRIA